MNHPTNYGNIPKVLNESTLPVELQSTNVVNPAFVLSTSNGNPAPRKIYTPPQDPQAYVVITEQPQQRGFRFRYECEGPSHGGLQGVKTEKSKKTYPSIRIENFVGDVRISVSLVTDEKSPRPHAHKLVGSNCNKNGSCTIDQKVTGEPISFPNLCVLHVTRKQLPDVLTERLLESVKLNKKIKRNNMNDEPEITPEEAAQARLQAVEQAKNMQLNVVRLLFQVFLKNSDGHLYHLLTPVVSQPIYDSKSPGASALKICRMDKYGGCCSGNEEVFLLCEKVQKDDIQVRFVEQNPDGSVKWEAYGNFGPLDVHRQYAIVFKTPPYWDTNIDKAVNVLIMLQRKSDSEVSEPKAFTYLPQNRDKDNIQSKKRKRIPLDGPGFGDGGTGMGGDGGGGGSGNSGGRGGGGGGVPLGDVIFVNNLQNSANASALSQNLPVTEVVPTQELTESDRLIEELNNLDTDSDVDFLFKSDSDIEVDSTLTKASDLNQRKKSEHSLLNKNSNLKPNALSIRQNDQSLDSNPISPVYLSADRLDSGVVTDVGKFINNSIVEHKNIEQSQITTQDSALTTSQEVCNKNGSRRLANDWIDSSSVQDGEGIDKRIYFSSEGELKVGNVSVGIKSDEGFSETSDELNSKLTKDTTQQKSMKLHTCEQKAISMDDQVRRITETTLKALSDYAETGDIRHLLLVQRHLMSAGNKHGDLPLHSAVINNKPDALKIFLDVMSTHPETKLRIDSYNLLRQTPLHLATIVQSQTMLELLLQHGADPTLCDRRGNTPAHLAVLGGSSACLHSLVQHSRLNESKQHSSELNYLNYDGFSPVHLAVQNSQVEMLEILCHGQADIDLVDGTSGKTGLHHAVDNNDIQVAAFLIMEAGAEVNSRSFDGNTPLHFACARGYVSMVALLVMTGADVDCENEEIPSPTLYEDDDENDCLTVGRRGMRPHDYACGHKQIISLLNRSYKTGEDSTSLCELVKCLEEMCVEEAGTGEGQDDLLLSHLQPDSKTDVSISKLSTKSRIDASRLLDQTRPGQDVLAVAKHLGYLNILDTLQSIRDSGTSPSTFFLEYFETDEGKLNSLIDCLQSLERADVVSVLSSSCL